MLATLSSDDPAWVRRANGWLRVMQLDAWVSTYTAIGSNVMADPTDAVQAITGTPPTSLAEFLRGRR